MTRTTGCHPSSRLLSWEAIRYHNTSQAQRDDDGLVISEVRFDVPESMNLRPDEEETEEVSTDAITVDDICNLDPSSKPSSMSSMERWATMSASEECFPLLAKRSMLDAGLNAEAKPSFPMRNAAAQNFTFEQQNVWLKVVRSEGRFAIEASVEDDPKRHLTDALQEQPTLCSSKNHINGNIPASRRSGMVAKAFRGGRRRRQCVVHRSHPQVIPD